MNASNKRAFSLIEMIVVMAIISTLSVIGVLSVKSNTDTRNLQAAVYELSTLMGATRDMALTHNTTAYLLVNNDPSDTLKYRRYAVAVYQSVDANGNTVWLMDRKGLYLPQGVYFDNDAVQGVSQSVAGADAAAALPEMVQFDPINMIKDAGTNWLAYEFSSNGTCLQAGSGVILAIGTISNANLQVGKGGMRDGFVLQRLGSVVFFQNASQILSML
jgi:prepilin-type N-terminal cleavage/methylation domain-containing protein